MSPRLFDYVTRTAPRYPEIEAPAVIVTGDKDTIVLPRVHSLGLERDLQNRRTGLGEETSATSRTMWRPISPSPRLRNSPACRATCKRLHENWNVRSPTTATGRFIAAWVTNTLSRQMPDRPSDPI